MTAAAKSQYRLAFCGELLKRYPPAVRGKLRIDFSLQHVANALNDARIGRRRNTFDTRGFYRDLTAGVAAREVQLSAVQKRHAGTIHVQRETIAIDGPLVADSVINIAKL
jgi:hypothetical protein